jgi:hypothetical protein
VCSCDACHAHAEPRAIEPPLRAHPDGTSGGHAIDEVKIDGKRSDGVLPKLEAHLYKEELLRAIQEQCGFLPGELRCIFVESQPLGRSTMAYRIHDASTGLLEAGELDVRELGHRQPLSAV